MPREHTPTIRTRYHCEKRTKIEDEYGDYDYNSVYCDEFHATLGLARKHCIALNYTHTVEHVMIGYDDGEYFTIEDDEFKSRPITMTYKEASR